MALEIKHHFTNCTVKQSRYMQTTCRSVFFSKIWTYTVNDQFLHNYSRSRSNIFLTVMMFTVIIVIITHYLLQAGRHSQPGADGILVVECISAGARTEARLIFFYPDFSANFNYISQIMQHLSVKLIQAICFWKRFETDRWTSWD